MASIKGRGFGGLSTSGPENTHTKIGKGDIAGNEFGPYRSKNNGIKIRFTSAKRKTKISNPKI